MNKSEISQDLWYADPLSCLYSAFGTVLSQRGIDPLLSLGRNCRFDFNLDDHPREEFYRVSRSPDGVLADIAPGLGFTSDWHEAADVEGIAAMLNHHDTVIVAVDNYHLPFRPAYQDVHAAHLVIVSDSRRTDGGLQLLVADAQPPAFSGWLDAAHLTAAAFSVNPADEQDAFFSDAPIAGRLLTFATDRSGPPSAASEDELLVSALAANMSSWNEPHEPGRSELEGRAGLEVLKRKLTQSDSTFLRSLYTAGWSPQAEAHLHAQLCRRLGKTRGDFDLLDVADASRGVALAWTDVRLIGAYPPGRTALDRSVSFYGGRLTDAYQRTADAASRWLTRSQVTS